MFEDLRYIWYVLKYQKSVSRLVERIRSEVDKDDYSKSTYELADRTIKYGRKARKLERQAERIPEDNKHKLGGYTLAWTN